MVLGSAVVTSEGRGWVGDSSEQGPLKGDCCLERGVGGGLCPLASSPACPPETDPTGQVPPAEEWESIARFSK